MLVVAPHAGAWIETKRLCHLYKSTEWSRPMRARGLKHFINSGSSKSILSRPMRARGLKLLMGMVNCKDEIVAPHAGAWIETRSSYQCGQARRSRAPCGRVD